MTNLCFFDIISERSKDSRWVKPINPAEDSHLIYFDCFLFSCVCAYGSIFLGAINNYPGGETTHA